MVRFVFLLLFVIAFGSAALTLRDCSGRVSTDEAIPQQQAEKIAVLQDGSVMFAPDGTVTRALTDWLEQPDEKARWFELGGTQFLGRSVEPTAFTEKRLPKLEQMLKAYPKVKASLVGHTGVTDDIQDDQRLSTARAEWARHWLIAAGTSARRLTASGAGSSHPLFANRSSQAGRNERVTLQLSF